VHPGHTTGPTWKRFLAKAALPGYLLDCQIAGFRRLDGGSAMLKISITTIAAIAAISLVPATAAAQPAYNWSGIYVGAHAGGAWATSDWTFYNGIDPEAFHQNPASWAAGVQIGGLYQFSSNWVMGVEGSWSATDLNATSASTLTSGRTRESKISDMILATARLGYVSNQWMTYVKGGYANAQLDFSSYDTDAGLKTSTSSGRDGGWTLGAGVEYQLSRAVSFGLEYNYVHIDIANRNQKVDTADGYASPETVTAAKADASTVWLRVNFKLNGMFSH